MNHAAVPPVVFSDAAGNEPAQHQRPAGDLGGLMQRYDGPRAQTLPRKRGRPLKLTPEYFRDLLIRHDKAVAWFVHLYGLEPMSDTELYVRLYAEEFIERGERPDRAGEIGFKKALKTLKNELAKARAWHRTNPVKPPFYGIESDVK